MLATNKTCCRAKSICTLAANKTCCRAKSIRTLVANKACCTAKSIRTLVAKKVCCTAKSIGLTLVRGRKMPLVRFRSNVYVVKGFFTLQLDSSKQRNADVARMLGYKFTSFSSALHSQPSYTIISNVRVGYHFNSSATSIQTLALKSFMMKYYLAIFSILLCSALPVIGTRVTLPHNTGIPLQLLEPLFNSSHHVGKRLAIDPIFSQQLCCWACGGDGGITCCCDYNPYYERCTSNGCAILPAPPS